MHNFKVLLPYNWCAITTQTHTSLQALLHFLSLRLPEDSQWEIRAYADHMAEIAEPIVPEAFDAFYENGQTF